ncbi:MAG: hypothetical protein R2831_06300 [Chitinophagaceae bacterium]
MKQMVVFGQTAVTSNPKRRHNRQQTNIKTTDKMPTLRKIKRAATQRTNQRLQHILFCPTAPKPTHHPDNWTSGLLDKNGLDNGIKF